MSNLRDHQYRDSTKFNARIYLHSRFGANTYPWPRWVFDAFRKEDALKVLETGCGNGLLWKVNAGRVPESWKITLSDFSEGMLNDARKTIGESIRSVTYEVMDIENIPHEDGSFDMVIANLMLYHVPDRKKALSEICRVLKKDGTFYATTLRGGYMREMKELIREYRSGHSGGNAANPVISNFSIENGEEQLKPYFNEVLLKIYENTLVINEAGPFVKYVFSSIDMRQGKVILSDNEKEPFLEFVKDKINKNGNIVVPSDFGMFICRNVN